VVLLEEHIFDAREINDGLSGGLWSQFKAKEFEFVDKISELDTIKMQEMDFLIHKAWVDGERFPNVKYHLLLGGELLEVDNGTIKEKLGERILKYAEETSKLPFNVVFEKSFKNGSVQLKYDPSSDQSFAIKIAKEMYTGENDLEVYLKNLPMESPKNLDSAQNMVTNTILPIKDSALIRSFEKDGSVFIENAEVVDINYRSDRFQEHETFFYLVKAKDGMVSDGQKDGRTEPFEFINFKISESLCEKSQLQIGEKVSFKGKITTHRKLGFILQNIRKLDKS
jgi:hypothetical protein